MRKLLTIREISDIQPIEGADFIELATVDGWRCVVGKGDFKIKDECFYFEIDSFIPTSLFDKLTFLQKQKITWKGQDGARIKTIRLKGATSQGLAIPISVLTNETISEEIDYTDLFNIKLWEREYSVTGARLGRQGGEFPHFIRKTNQERIQNIYKYIIRGAFGYHIDDIYEVSEKENGSSMTVFYNSTQVTEDLNVEFGVCSHNFLIKKDENMEGSLRSIFWRLAEKYDLEAKLASLGRNLAIQGEAVGLGIQKNHLQLKENEFHVFDIWDIDAQTYLKSDERLSICEELDLIHVPVLNISYMLDFKDALEAVEFAKGKSAINENVMREGLVFKSLNNPNVSFKIINNDYLLKHGD